MFVFSRPPGARGTVSKFKLHDEDELPENKKADATGGAENTSKSAMKNKKRREKKKDGEGEVPAYVPPAPVAAARTPAAAGGQANNGVDPELAKKLRKLNDKLVQISKLKAMQKEGKKLEINQLDKIKKEQELLDEMKALKINS